MPNRILENLQLITNSKSGLSLLQEWVDTTAAAANFSIGSSDLEVSQWEEVTIESVAEFTNGFAFESKEYCDSGVGIVRMSDLKNGEISTQQMKFVGKRFLDELSPSLQIKPNDLVIGMSGSIGRPCFNRTNQTFLLNQRVGKLTPDKSKITSDYLSICLASLEKYFLRISMGSAIKNLSTAQIKKAKIVLPPLDVQLEIAKKHKEISALREELQEQQRSVRISSEAFRKSAVNTLAVVSSPEELEVAWNLIRDNWGIMSGSSDGVSDLRSLIFTLATGGLLSTQSSQEQPMPFHATEGPSLIPSNWIWCELAEIASYGGGGTAKANEIPNDSWLLDLEDIEKVSSKLITRTSSSAKQTTSSKAKFEAGDVLYGKLRPYLDKVLVADVAGYCTTEIVPIRPKHGIDPRYLRICLKRPDFINHVNKLSYGTKMPRLGTSDAKASVHPVPPLSEQLRIVEKVEGMLSLCDRLQESFEEASLYSELFTKALFSTPLT
jgi:restriction endonuclease S subunit